MSVKQAKNGYYYCKFQVSGVQKHVKCGNATTKREAEKFERLLKKKVQEEIDSLKSNNDRYLITDLFDLHLTYALGNKLRDIKHLKSHHKYFRQYFKERNIVYVDEIKKSTISDIRTELLEDDHQTATVNRYFSTIAKMLALAVDDNIIEKNPCAGIKKIPEDNIQFKLWTSDEALKVIKNSNDLLQDMIKTALYTGFRKSNIRLMEKSWINFNNKTITVPAYANKSKKDLTIPINDELYKILEARILDTNNKTLYVFIDMFKQAPIVDDTMRKWLKRTCEVSKIKYIGWHGLRHTFATNAIMAGMNPVELKEILGHSTLLMVQRYAHATDSRKREVINKMPKF